MEFSKNPKLFFLIIAAQALFIGRTSSLGCDRTVLNVGVSNQDKQMIVDMHNKMRQVVALGQVNNQPPAADMLKMTWSDELAQRAQQWATACSSQIHDSGRHLGAYQVGQNIASRWTTRPPSSYQDTQADWANDAIYKWFNEHSIYTFTSNPRHSTGHYTQLIWAKTTLVGCGYAFFLDRNKRYTKKYVCNYGPSGNVYGELPYQKGYPSCFAQKLTESRQFPGLCEQGSIISYAKNQNNYNKYYSNYNHNRNNNLGNRNSYNSIFVFDSYGYLG